LDVWCYSVESSWMFLLNTRTSFSGGIFLYSWWIPHDLSRKLSTEAICDVPWQPARPMIWVVMMRVTPSAPGSDVSRGIATMNPGSWKNAQHLGKKRECVKAFQELLFAYLGNINHPFTSINQLLVPGFYRIAFFERCLRGYTWCQGLLRESPWHLVVGVHPWVLYGAIDGIILAWFMCMIAKKSDPETYHWNLDEFWREIPWTHY
jgi:hypothetical protein